MKLVCVFASVLLLSACETTNLYSWGGYQNQLYRYYDKPEKRLQILQTLESHISKLESKNQKVPPGLYAEVGTFYLELGDELQAVAFYKKEADTWPESEAFMRAMISNLEARVVKKEASDAS